MPGWVKPGGYAPAFGGGNRKQRAPKADAPSRVAVPSSPPKASTTPPENVQADSEMAAELAALSSATAPELFRRIADRGLLRMSNRDVAEEILACEYQIAVVNAVTDVSPTWTAKCVRPPFSSLWIEYHYLEMLCGALITEMDSDVFTIRFVTSSKDERAKPQLWRGLETSELSADGRLTSRTPAITQNSIPQLHRKTLEGVFDSVYLHLATINEIHSRERKQSKAGDGPRELKPAEPHELGTVVLVWGDDDAAGTGAPLGSLRHGPTGHPVRGHQRRLGEGRTTWIRPYVTGRGSGADPAKPRVYKVRRRD